MHRDRDPISCLLYLLGAGLLFTGIAQMLVAIAVSVFLVDITHSGGLCLALVVVMATVVAVWYWYSKGK